ncbi:MAG: sulfurtransferase complex subunit TusD [Pantoea sp. Brub]|nr:sulfurtransferase complex subunit TusD [Pantoea sp. Brub]
MRYNLLVTGPPYGTQQATSAIMFSRALIKTGHELQSIFFYREGVSNANKFIIPANNFNLVSEWQTLSKKQGIKLYVCITAALSRGIINLKESKQYNLTGYNLQSYFELTGLGTFAKLIIDCDRVVQF